MPLLSEMKTSAPKILLYGSSGSGKSVLATTLGSDADLIDTDGSLLSVKRFNDKWTQTRGQINVLDCLEVDALNSAIAFEKAKSYVHSIAGQCQKKTYPKKALIIDSWTSLCSACIRRVSGMTGSVVKKLGFNEWGIVVTELENFLFVAKSLPILVVMTAHQMEVPIKTAGGEAEEEELTMTKILTPTQKLPDKVSNMFDERWHLEMKEEAGGKLVSRVQVKTGRLIDANTRLNIENNLDASLGLKEILKKGGFDLDTFKPF